jgi:hypothetical protein
MDSKKDDQTETDTTTTATVTSNDSTSDNGALMATTRTNWRSVYIIVAIFFVVRHLLNFFLILPIFRFSLNQK